MKRTVANKKNTKMTQWMRRTRTTVIAGFVGLVTSGIFLCSVLTNAEVIVNDETISPPGKAAGNSEGETTGPAFNTNGRDGRGVISRVIPQASVVVSSYVGSDASSLSAKEGFGAGVTVDLGRDDLVFESGVLYRQMGSLDKSNYGTTVTLDTSYVSVPFAGKLYLGGQTDSAAYIKAGLMPSFLLSNEAKGSTPYISVGPADLNFFDLDFIVGLGGKIQINSSASILVEVSYLRGITSVLADPNLGGSYNSALMLTAGVGFDSN